jgi:hypothetical protein
LLIQPRRRATSKRQHPRIPGRRRGYRINPEPIICILFIIGTQLAAIIVDMKIHGRTAMIASTTMAISSAFAQVGHAPLGIA